MEIHLSSDSTDLPPITEHQPVEFVCAAPPGTRLKLTVDGQPLDPFLRPGEPAWHWRWNPGPAVGLHQATMTVLQPDGSTAEWAITLRVVPRKIDQERYEALLEDIQRIAYGVAFTLAGAGAEGAALQRDVPWRRSLAEEYYSLFEGRLETFAGAVRRIAARPRERLSTAQEQTALGQIATLEADALAQLARGPFDEAPPDIAAELQEALRPGGGLLPRDVPAPRSMPTTDIYEHRLLKHLLATLLRRARFIGVLAEREAARLTEREPFSGGGTRLARARQIAAGSTEVARMLRELRALPFLADVRPLAAFRGVTPLLQRDAAYREIYRMWQALRQHPYIAFDSPLFAIPIGDLPRLYESWCTLEITRALLELGGTVREQRLVQQRPPRDDEDELELALTLAEQAPLLVIDFEGVTLTLRYQPRYRPIRTENQEPRTENQEPRTTDAKAEDSRFSVGYPLGGSGRLGSLDRHTHIPDIAIELRRPGAPPQVLILDAKYRLDAEGRGVPPDALADAYTYYSAIGYAGTRATLGAILLYPGTSEPERYASGVGALPLLPNRAAGLREQLTAWLAARGELPLAKPQNV